MTILASISDPALVAVIALVGTLVAAGISAYASRRQSKATLEAAEAQNQATLKAAEAQNRTTLEIARAQNDATHEEGGRVRFANWQLKKREVYAEFVEGARAHRDDPSNQEAENEFFFNAHRAMLFSNKELRAELWKLVGDPGRLREPERWKALVEALGEDARAVKAADWPARQRQGAVYSARSARRIERTSGWQGCPGPSDMAGVGWASRFPLMIPGGLNGWQSDPWRRSPSSAVR